MIVSLERVSLSELYIVAKFEQIYRNENFFCELHTRLMRTSKKPGKQKNRVHLVGNTREAIV